MKIIISPAKKMRVYAEWMQEVQSPQLIEKTEELLAVLREYSRQELKELYAANDRITELNYQRLQTMNLSDAISPALLSYVGIQYQSMSPEVFTIEEWDYIKNHLYILSGFYGILRPDDKVVPYRLEMQSKLSLNQTSNLYEFWGDDIYHTLVCDESVVINLASKEYSKGLIPFLKPEVSFVTCTFGTWKNGKITTVATAAKIARGTMVRWMAQEQVETLDAVKEFNQLGYKYNKELSTETNYVYIKAE